MRERMLILGALGLALSFPAVPVLNGSSAWSANQDQDQAKSDDKAPSKPAPKSDSHTDRDADPRIVPRSRSKPSSQPDSKTTSRSKDKSPAKPAAKKGTLSMSPAVVCRSIDGYEQYEPLPDAAQTSEEKLLVYLRPLGFKTRRAGDLFEAHLFPDFEIRKRGEKRILLQKKKYMEYHPTTEEPPRYIYLKSVISLKGLAPGNYDLSIILHDEIAKEDPATQVVKFRVIPAADPREKTDVPDREP